MMRFKDKKYMIVTSPAKIAQSVVFLMLNIASRYLLKMVTQDRKDAFLCVLTGPEIADIYFRMQPDVAKQWVALDQSAEEYLQIRDEVG